MKKAKNKKKLIYSAVFLLLSVAAATTAILGWFNMSKNPNIGFLELQVISHNASAKFNIGFNEQGEVLPLTNLGPGDECEFGMLLENEGEEYITFNIYFSGLSDNLSENGVELDMVGIFAVRQQGEQNASYFREIEDEGKILIFEDVTIPPLDTQPLTFFLIFCNQYMYEDYSLTGDIDIINQFQGKEFNISTLIVEVS